MREFTLADLAEQLQPGRGDYLRKCARRSLSFARQVRGSKTSRQHFRQLAGKLDDPITRVFAEQLVTDALREADLLEHVSTTVAPTVKGAPPEAGTTTRAAEAADIFS